MGLIARETEERGIPTISLTSALSITRSVNPPRAVFTDYPLGHTSGKPGDAYSQRHILNVALNTLAYATEPTTIDTKLFWAENDDWKNRVMLPAESGPNAGDYDDDRTERLDTPQYQLSTDEAKADPECETCVWLA
ncbi:MAG: hypothetical protein MK322_12925 [Pseudomonadales bacterium]|nr:hypothetical protein [Pseudomonadales bacterium]HAO55298.1 hypothetical protein [Gammaproteobacteria bacterium]